MNDFPGQVVKELDLPLIGTVYAMAIGQASYYVGEDGGTDGVCVLISNHRGTHFDYGRISNKPTKNTRVFIPTQPKAGSVYDEFSTPLYIEKVVN